MSVTQNQTLGGRGFLSDDDGDSELYPIHGIALGPNDVTRGHLSGERKLWTPQVLEEAAHTLEGKSIVVNHENRDAREVIGEVTDARFEEGTGVIYQGVIDDEELAQKIGQNWLEVSPRIIHSEEMEERENVKVPEAIHRFDNLSVVTNGAAPSNLVDLGEHSELMAVEELQEAFDEPSGVTELQERVEETQQFDLRTHLYETREGAQGALQGLECDQGVHEHTVDGKTWFMPCDSHDSFLQAMRKKNSEEMTCSTCNCGGEPEELLLSEARRPEYDGTETTSWGEIDADTLEHYTENLDFDAETWEDLSQEQRNEISSHTLLGDPDAETTSQGIFFPVVNASTGNLNRGALEAVRSGRGQSADIDSSTYESAFATAGQLLNEEFDTDVETNFEEMSKDLEELDVEEISEELSEHPEFDEAEKDDILGALKNIGEAEENSEENETGDDSSVDEFSTIAEVVGMTQARTIKSD